jgi:hypothetical protein
MTHALDVAGLVFNAAGASLLALCYAWNGSELRPNGSVTVGGNPNHSNEQRIRINIRRYRIQRFGIPTGWLLFVTGFILQLLAIL